MSKTTNTAKKSSVKESPTVFWTPPLSSETSENSSAKDGLNDTAARWISLLPDFRASRFLPLEVCSDKTTKGICGQKLSKPFAKYDHHSHSWRTSQISLP